MGPKKKEDDAEVITAPTDVITAEEPADDIGLSEPYEVATWKDSDTARIDTDIETESEAIALCKTLVKDGERDRHTGIVSRYQGPEDNPWKWREVFRCVNKAGKVVQQPIVHG